MYQLTQRGPGTKALELLTRLLQLTEQSERTNWPLHIRTAKGLSRVCGRQKSVMNALVSLTRKATDMIGAATMSSELAYQQMMVGMHHEAIRIYREVCRSDCASIEALCGLVHCLILSGELEDATQQLDFMLIAFDCSTSAYLCYIQGLLVRHTTKNQHKHLRFIERAEELRTLGSSKANFLDVYDMYVLQDPDFVTMLASEYLEHMQPSSADFGGIASIGELMQPEAAKHGLELLEKTTAQFPGIIQAHLLLAHAHRIMRQWEKAHLVLKKAIAVEPQCADAHLLLAAILVSRDAGSDAEEALQDALACDFHIRNKSAYHRVKATILSKRCAHRDALQHLKVAAGLTDAQLDYTIGSMHMPSLQLFETSSAYIELSSVYVALNDMDQAESVLLEAESKFRDTPAESSILVALTELAVKLGKVDLAVRIMNLVPTTKSTYLIAQHCKAQCYLEARHDKLSFMSCYRDMARSSPSVITLERSMPVSTQC